MITGFPTETEQDHQDTLSLMEYVKYNFGYMYSYSERPGTLAGRKMDDDVTEETKARRLQEIVDLQQNMLGRDLRNLLNSRSFGEGFKKSTEEFSGRNSQSITVVFQRRNYKIGDFVNVKINSCTSGTLKGQAVIE
jgi:tRNA-2-methylthio-N6-dimethylallyladenosine synthase